MRFAKIVNGKPGPDPAEFGRLTEDTQQMARWVDQYVRGEYCQEIVITSMIRPGPPGSHADGRAFDFRTADWPDRWSRAVESAIRLQFGATFPDPHAPERMLWRAWWHNSGRGWHMHCASPT